MDYRGFRYVLRASIVRGQWRVVVYLDNGDPVERTFKGVRRGAELLAQSIIDQLLKGEKVSRVQQSK